MKALAKLKPEPGIWMTKMPMPEMGPKDVIIRIKKTGICGTDLHIYKWDEWAKKTISIPMTIGHEFVGEIVELGSVVTGLKLGDRVSGDGHITCGQCRNCRIGKRHLCPYTKGIGVNRPGCFAEYLVLPACNVFKLPDCISNEIASILDPFGNATHTALAFNMVGDDVLITGAGPIGIMAAAIAKHVGARNIVITDVNDYRLTIAKQMGATRAININKHTIDSVMQELAITEGFAIGLEMSGNGQALNDMIKIMMNGGKIALLGISANNTAVDWNQIIFKELTLQGIYGREMFDTWYKMVSMLESGLNIMPVITHEFHADEFQKGFDVMLSGYSGKVILNWE